MVSVVVLAFSQKSYDLIWRCPVKSKHLRGFRAVHLENLPVARSCRHIASESSDNDWRLADVDSDSVMCDATEDCVLLCIF